MQQIDYGGKMCMRGWHEEWLGRVMPKGECRPM